MWNFGELFAKKNKLDASTKIGSSLSNSSLRKQPTFRDDTTGFPAKCMTFGKRAQKLRPNDSSLPRSIWLRICFNQSEALLTFLRRHFVGKTTVVARRNCGCFLRPFKLITKQRSMMNKQNRQNAKPRKWNVTHRFSFHVTYKVLFSAICVCVLNLILLRGADPGKLYYYLFPSCLPRITFYLGNLSDMHMADDAITRQNLIKIRNKPHAYHVTISFSFSPCLHIVKVPIASIQGNFLSHAFKLFVFAKKCSFLIGSHRISFPYLLNYVHSLTTKGKRFCDEKSWK